MRWLMSLAVPKRFKLSTSSESAEMALFHYMLRPFSIPQDQQYHFSLLMVAFTIPRILHSRVVSGFLRRACGTREALSLLAFHCRSHFV